MRRPTLEDVAARAGVGRGTVSRVVNGSPQVGERTRAAVMRAIRELGYVPNPAARSLASSRAGTIALVLSEEPERRFEQPFLGQIVDGVGSAADAAGLALTMVFTQSRDDRSAVLRQVNIPQVDGVVLFSLLRHDPLAGLLERGGVPTVLGGRPDGDTGGVAYVDADNRGGSRRATEHLIGTGRRRIATIAGLPNTSVGADRLTGYRRALGDLPEQVAFGDFSEAGGVLAMRRLLETRAGLDAVFVASDTMATGALRELDRRGRRVPDDVAVVGFEDTARFRATPPTLTTVHQPTEDMGRQLVKSLIARIDAASDVQAPVIVDTDLVLRRSA